MNKQLLLAAAATLTVSVHTSLADDGDVPKPLEFARYQAMMDRSPFSIATAPAATPPPAPNFAKDWYIANAARSPDGDLVTIASSTDKNFKLYLNTREPVDGVSISNIEWSDKVGGTKATITKDGQFSTLTFNQALLSQPIANPPAAPQPAPGQQPIPGQPQGMPQPVPQVPGSAPANNTPIKPAPIPTLPTPPPRVRSVIQRNPQAPPAAPVPTPGDSQD